MVDEKATDSRISVDIKGDTFKYALALRHKQEAEEGRIVGISEIVRDAVKEKYERELEKEVVTR